jgi:hypothetical protein
MGTSTYDFEGTTGNLPDAMSSGYGTFGVFTLPAGTSSDWSISTLVASHGAKSGRVNGSNSPTFMAQFCNTPTATTYIRGYAYLSAAPADHFYLAWLFGGSFLTLATFGISTDRRFFVQQAAAGNVIPANGNSAQSAANTCALSEWFRFEVKMTATSVHGKVWKASGAGIDSTGTPDWDSTEVTGSSIGALDQVAIGGYSPDGSGGYTQFISSAQALHHDNFAASDAGWIGPASSLVTGDAAATATASGTSGATATRLLAATPSITLSGTAAAGKIVLTDATPSITLAGSADASVVTTHNAEAVGTIATSATAGAVTVRPITAAAALTASASATAAQDGGAEGQLIAIGTARAVVEGETSPGFLYGSVKKNVLTS